MAEESQTVDYEALRERAGEDALTDGDLDVIADVAVDFLKAVCHCFGENTCSIDEFEGEDGELILNIEGGDLAILIGRHGRCLEALQTLLTSMMNQTFGFYYPVIVDIEGYRQRRREKVVSMARRAASRVRRNGNDYRLPAMNAYERRLVHIALRNDTGLITHSEGDDPNRYVVVTAVRERDTPALYD